MTAATPLALDLDQRRSRLGPGLRGLWRPQHAAVRVVLLLLLLRQLVIIVIIIVVIVVIAHFVLRVQAIAKGSLIVIIIIVVIVIVLEVEVEDGTASAGSGIDAMTAP